MFGPRSLFVSALVLLASFAALVRAQDLAASKGTDAPPPELADPIRAMLDPLATDVKIGGTTATFWWVKQMPLKAAGAAAWDNIEEGTLVGAVRLRRLQRDIRGRTIKPGVYTLRYGIQPANGDHLGVSPHREFLLVSPATIDSAAAPAGHDGTIDMAKRSIGVSHPAVFEIDPLNATEAPLQVHANDLGHQAVIVQVNTAGGPLKFGVVLIGKIEA